MRIKSGAGAALAQFGVGIAATGVTKLATAAARNIQQRKTKKQGSPKSPVNEETGRYNNYKLGMRNYSTPPSIVYKVGENEILDELLRARYNFGDEPSICFPMMLDETHTTEVEAPQYPVDENFNLTDHIRLKPREFTGRILLIHSFEPKTTEPVRSAAHQAILTAQETGVPLTSKDMRKLQRQEAKESKALRRKTKGARLGRFMEVVTGQARAAELRRESIEASNNISWSSETPYLQYEVLKEIVKAKIPVYFINSFEEYQNMLITSIQVQRNPQNAYRIEVDIEMKEVQFASSPQIQIIPQTERVETKTGKSSRTVVGDATCSDNGAVTGNGSR